MCVCVDSISGRTKTVWPLGYENHCEALTVRICMTQWHCTYLLCLLSLLHAAVSVYARMCACLLRSEEEGCVSLQGFGLRLHVSREDEHYTPLICLISPTIHTSANPLLSPFLTFPLYLLIKSTASLISQIFSSVYPWLLLCSCLLLKIMQRHRVLFCSISYHYHTLDDNLRVAVAHLASKIGSLVG